jgi:uroporphyrinogen-III synthase
VVSARSLSGRRIVVTSPGALADRLREFGVDVVDAPTIAIVGDAVTDVDPAAFDWVAYTSANAVARVDPRGARRVAAVGPATAAAVEAAGVAVDLVAREAVAEALVEAFPDGPGSVLLPQAERARAVLADGLRAKGWDVRVVAAYATAPVEPSEEVLRAAATADAITFLSASATETWPPDCVPSRVVCIGPITAAAARDRGIAVAAVADPHTIDGVIGALVAVLA